MATAPTKTTKTGPETDFLAQLDVAFLTDQGYKRQKNEDSCRVFVPPPNTPERAFGGLFVVADGMGGLGGGDVASQAGIDQFARYYFDPSIREAELSARLEAGLEAANQFVRNQAERVGLLRIGTTAAGMALRSNGQMALFNVGDCRVYRIRDGKLARLSEDQSVMERQIQSGQLTEEEARASRNSMVTAFLGQPIPIQPYMRRQQVERSDVYVICSDGLWSLIEADEMLRLARNAPAHKAVKDLVALALKRGGTDNVTVIVARFGKGGGITPRWRNALLLSGVVGLLTAGALALRNQQIGNASPPPPAAIATDAPATITIAPVVLPSSTSTNTPTATEDTSYSVTLLSPTLTTTPTPSNTFTPTVTNTATFTSTPTSSRTATNTHTATFTNTPTPSQTATSSATASLTNTATATVPPAAPATNTPRPSNTPTANTATPSETAAPVATNTIIPTATKSDF
jgi:serine/threonine protein phosphatase PrpC